MTTWPTVDTVVGDAVFPMVIAGAMLAVLVTTQAMASPGAGVTVLDVPAPDGRDGLVAPLLVQDQDGV